MASDGLGGPRLEVAAGSRVTEVVGPLDYAFRTYSILCESTPRATSTAAAQPLIAAGTGEFSMASVNLRRLLAPVADARYDKIVKAIREVLRTPDVIAVQEVDTIAVLTALAQRLGPEWRASLEEGNDIGGIDSGFLVNSSRVTVTSVTQEGKTATYATPAGASATLHDRPPLVMRASASGFPFTAIALHQRSLIDADTPEVQAKRRAQAEAVAAIVQTRAAANPGEGLVVLGDFNAFPFSDGLVDVTGIIAGGTRPALTSLVSFLPRDQGYSYVQDGSAQVLDQFLVNDVMRARLTRYQSAHVNADFPESLNADATRVERYSDHDPPVAHFRTGAAPALTAAGVTTAASFLTGAVSPGEIATLFGTGLQGARFLFDGTAAPVIYALPNQAAVIAPYTLIGKSTTRFRAELSSQTAVEVELPVVASTPAFFQVPGRSQGAFLNQDGSLNGTANPAVRGSIVVLYATGEGSMTPAMLAGSIVATPLPMPTLPVSVLIDGWPAEVLYAGGTPGQVTGLLQVNVTVPLQARAGEVPVVLTVGDASSDAAVPATLALR